MATCEQRRHTRKTREAREGRHHVVHTKVLQVEATRCTLLGLTVGRGEVAIGVCVCPRWRDMGRVKHICVDEVELLTLARHFVKCRQ